MDMHIDQTGHHIFSSGINRLSSGRGRQGFADLFHQTVFHNNIKCIINTLGWVDNPAAFDQKIHIFYLVIISNFVGAILPIALMCG